jgi:homoserine O-acetyltransferase
MLATRAAQAHPAPQERDFIIKGFHFRSGESLAELRIHYRTLGSPARDSHGVVTNAVLILHGTSGSGKQFLAPQFAHELFEPGQLLDATRYFIILPDNLGHGGSSKPSDGLRARFPAYDYDDMVEAQYRLVTEGLGVKHLRLVMGTSMGCMHGWLWGETHPDAMDALMPLACLPVPIAGRNRIWRKAAIEVIRADPAWDHGNYKEQPLTGLRGAASIMLLLGSAPLLWQKQYGTHDAADGFVAQGVAERLKNLDANDLIYALDASRNYDPAPRLSEIKAPVMFVNSADDMINPPELGIAEREIKHVPRGRFVLVPVSDATHGHGTHTWAVFWKAHLAELLQQSAKQ